MSSAIECYGTLQLKYQADAGSFKPELPGLGVIYTGGRVHVAVHGEVADGFYSSYLTFGRELLNPMENVLRGSSGEDAPPSTSAECARWLYDRMEEAFAKAC